MAGFDLPMGRGDGATILSSMTCQDKSIACCNPSDMAAPEALVMKRCKVALWQGEEFKDQRLVSQVTPPHVLG